MLSHKQSVFSHAKILLVDDQVDNLELLSTMLTSHDYEVSQSDRGSLAIELAQIDLPNLILLDICMPEMDGYEVCRLLKSNDLTRDIPIIFISAFKEIENKSQAFEIGGDDYITKPFYMKEVLLRVENQLKKHYLQSKLKAKNNHLQQEKSNLLEIEKELLSIIKNMI